MTGRKKDRGHRSGERAGTVVSPTSGSKRKVITAITTRTDAEWEADHPGRKGSLVLSNRAISQLQNALWVCTLVGEERRPAPPDDVDVETICNRCQRPIVHRASAAPHLEKICWVCFAKLGAPEVS